MSTVMKHCQRIGVQETRLRVSSAYGPSLRGRLSYLPCSPQPADCDMASGGGREETLSPCERRAKERLQSEEKLSKREVFE